MDVMALLRESDQRRQTIAPRLRNPGGTVHAPQEGVVMVAFEDGALGYVEIPSEDVERAKGFYTAVFGWTHQERPGGGYSFFDSGAGGIGGGFPAGEERPPHPVVFMICDDIELTLALVEDNHGRVVTPRTEFGDAGWLAHVCDTEGNLIGLWQARVG
jgi:predicted enzyme related to lactoylglutathione lyase